MFFFMNLSYSNILMRTNATDFIIDMIICYNNHTFQNVFLNTPMPESIMIRPPTAECRGGILKTMLLLFLLRIFVYHACKCLGYFPRDITIMGNGAALLLS